MIGPAFVACWKEPPKPKTRGYSCGFAGCILFKTDRQKAKRLLKQGAAKYCSPAMHLLAKMMLAKKKVKKARKYLEMAALLDDVQAAADLDHVNRVRNKARVFI